MSRSDTFHLSHALPGVEPAWRAALSRMRAEVKRVESYGYRPHPLQIVRYLGHLEPSSARKELRNVRGNHAIAQTASGSVLFPTLSMNLEAVRDFAATLVGGEPFEIQLVLDPAGAAPANATGLSALISQRLHHDRNVSRDLPVSDRGWKRIGVTNHAFERHMPGQLRRGFSLWDFSKPPKAGVAIMKAEGMMEYESRYVTGGGPLKSLPEGVTNLQRLDEGAVSGIETMRRSRPLKLFGAPDLDIGGYLYVAGNADHTDGDGPWKVGITRVCPEQRVRTGSGSPSFLGRKADLVLAVALPAKAVSLVEQITHQTLAGLRLPDPTGTAREWFRAPLKTVFEAISLTLSAGPGDARDMAFSDAKRGICFPIDTPEWHKIETRHRSWVSLQNSMIFSAPSPLHISMAEGFWGAISDAGGDRLLGPEPERVVFGVGVMNILSRGRLIPASSSMEAAITPEIRAEFNQGALTLIVTAAGSEPEAFTLSKEGTDLVFGRAADLLMSWKDGFSLNRSGGRIRFSSKGMDKGAFSLDPEELVHSEFGLPTPEDNLVPLPC